MSECSRWQPSDWCTHGHHSHQPHRAAAWQWLCDKHHAEVSDPPTNIRDTPVPKPLTDGHESVTMQAGPTNSVQSLALLHAPMPGNQAHPRMSLSHQGSLSRCPASDTTEVTMRVCNVPECPTLTDTPRCAEHTKAAEQRRGSAHARGYDAKWRRTRRRYLASHPLCSEPDCKAPATDVDHIDGLGPNGPHGHDPANLRAFCHRHHSQRTARDSPGGWAALN